MPKLIKRPVPKRREFTLREYYERRNSILILRNIGGLGDILVHRMIFEGFKAACPEIKIHFACPQKYHDAVKDHPYIDQILDCGPNGDKVDVINYVNFYNTTNPCARYETMLAPLSGKNRSDIWANHCGVQLTKHEMHINLEPEIKERTKKEVEKYRDANGPAILFTPISAMLNKNLMTSQIIEVTKRLRDRGYYVYSSHTGTIPALTQLKVPIFQGDIREWMGYVYAADYVISVDTAAFHMAGGIRKPVVGVFTFCDGKVYGRYYPTMELVQKHRDNGDWNCGPCYNWFICPKTRENPKPCLTELTSKMILEGLDKLILRFPIRNN